MIGTGYVGLVSGVCFSDLGNDVICVDKDINKINKFTGVRKSIQKKFIISTLPLFFYQIILFFD